MSYGTGPYGTGPYGGAGSLSVARAWATSTHSAHVELTAPAKATDPFDIGDALNPTTWTITRLNTAFEFTIIGVARVDDASNTHFEITVLEPLGDSTVEHRVETSNLLDASGIGIVAPYSADFPGVVDAPPQEPRQVRRARWRDLANPAFVDGANGHIVGTIVVKSDGDYGAEDGVAVAKKMVIRRVTTPRGSVRHLPRFGVGFQEKMPLPQGGDLSKLCKEIDDQCTEEPDIARATSEVLILGGGAVLVRVRAQLKSGVVFNVNVRRSASGNFVEL